MITTTIQGQIFDINEAYKAGHKLNDAEARALNQLRAENIGNNMRRDVLDVLGKERHEAKEKLTDEEHSDLQVKIAEYDADYDFSQVRLRGSSDPVQTEARHIARQLVANELKAQGMTLTEYQNKLGDGDTDKGKDAYKARIDEIAGKEAVQKRAKENVEFKV